MLVVFFGDDTVNVRRKAFEYVEQNSSEGVSVENLESDKFEAGALRNTVASNSLFDEKKIYVVDTPSLNKEFYNETIDCLEEMKNSEQTFVVIETTLLAAEKKRFSKYASTFEEYKGEKAERFNNFSLADALARKDKRSLWLLFNEARLAGIALEELSGVLWWQLKTLRLAKITNSAEEAGLKDFPYKKAKRALGNFATGELEQISHSLLTVIHESRMGAYDIDLELERWILRL